MADVVIDEWVLIRGLDAEQPATGFEHESAELLFALQQWHRWVVTEALIEVYLRRLYQARYKGAIWTRLLASRHESIVSSESALWLGAVAAVEGAYDSDDVAWVSAAAVAPAGCLLVTGDRRLLKQLAATDLPERHAFVPCFVTDALGALMRPS